MALTILAVHDRYALRGGEDEVFESETRLLAERGHRVERLVVDNATIGDGTLTRLRTAGHAVWNRAAARQMERLVDSLHPDVVHVHNTFPLLSPSVAWAARARAVPVVLTLHNYRLACLRGDLFRDGRACRRCLEAGHPLPGIRFRCYRDSLAGSLGAAAALEVHRRLRAWERSVSVFVAPSATTARLLRDRLPRARIVVKPHFVPEDPGPGPGGGAAVFAGRTSMEKGLDTILEAWRRHPDLPRLLIAGAGPPPGRPPPGASAPVEWLGRLARSDLIELFGHAAVLVSGSRCPETFGLTVIEAFARGTPAAVPSGTALAELVRRPSTGRVYEQGSPDALAQAVREIVDPRSQTAMRPAARRAFEERYTPAAGYELLIRTYRTALDR